MKKPTNGSIFTVALVLVTGLLPAVLFAEDSNLGGPIQGTASADVRVGGAGSVDVQSNVSENSQTTLPPRFLGGPVRGDNGQNGNNGTAGRQNPPPRFLGGPTKGDNGQNGNDGTSYRQNPPPRFLGGPVIGGEQDNTIEVRSDAVMDASSTVQNADQVSNDGQLRSYLNHVVKADDRIADVSISSSTVEAHYRLPARFLWAIPASITADVKVNSDGSVAVNYPWYGFLFSMNKSKVDQTLASTTASASAGVTATFSASMTAHLIDSLFAALRSSN